MSIHIDVRPGDGSVPSPVRVVLVHGAMDRARSFDKVRAALPASLTTIAYDRRGYAGSVDTVPPPDGFEIHVRDLLDVIGEQPAVVAGHSYGGDVALAAAEARPDLVQAIVAYESPMPWEPWWPDAQAGGGTLAIGRAHGPAVAAEAFMRRIVGDAVWERLPEATREARKAEGTALLVDLGGMRGRPRPFDPGRVRCPVVFAHGEESLPHHRKAAVEGRASVTGAPTELHVLPGARHGAHTTHPEGFAGLVLRAVALAVG